jgi:hypothetical protein
MSTVTINDINAIRTAFELQPLAAYIDAYDAGRVPANAIGYQVISQRIKVLLAPHVDNPHMRKLCAKSQSLCEILGNLVVEQEREMSLRIECAIEELKLTAY